MNFLRFSIYQRQMDRRVALRRPVRKAGMIEFPGGAFSCMVQDLSEGDSQEQKKWRSDLVNDISHLPLSARADYESEY